MQLIMPAAPPPLALSTPSPTLIPPPSFIPDPVPPSPPLPSSSPTISAPPLPHATSPPLSHPPKPPPDNCLLIASVPEPPAAALQLPLPSPPPLHPALAPDHHLLPFHSCRFCSRSFSCSRALRTHMRAHGSFYALCEGVGSTADIISKGADDQPYPDQRQNEFNENELLIDLSSNCKSETDDQYEEDELMYVLRRKPKRSRRFADQDFTREDQEALQRKNINVDGDDVESVGRIIPAASFKKPMFTCKLQDKPPPACTECGKEFNSWKALFGHMRCHPEREWRGIQPPGDHMQSSILRAHKDSVARNGALDRNRYIVVKRLQASKHDMLRRKEMVNQFRSSQAAASLSHDVIKANCNQSREGLAEDTILSGSIRGDESRLQWNSCRKQVMLEEEEESDTESIEAAYMSNNIKDEEDKCLHLLASFSRGKRSKRSHFTVKSLRSVQDQLAAKVDEGAQPIKDEDLEMANCLVMLALAGSVDVEGGNQEGGTVSKSDDDIDNDDEGTVDDQLRLTWGSNLCTLAAVGESKTLHIQNNVNPASSLDDMANAGEGGKYECAACKRSFKSHQALGGHRASHKKVKGCFAKTAADVEASPMTSKDGIATTTTYVDTSILTLAGICKDQMATPTTHLGTSLPDRNGDCKDLMTASSSAYVGTSAYDVSGGHLSGKGGLNMAGGAQNFAENGPAFQLLLGSVDGLTSRSSKLTLHNPSKFHQCSICQRVFSSGQALGGHKRCHWAADKADRHMPEIVGTGMSAMACVATPPAMAKLTFLARPPAVEEATHQVKVLDIDLNLPAPLDVDPEKSTNAKANTSKNNTTLGSLLSLGQCSSVTIHAPIDLDDESFHCGGPHTAGHHSAADRAACSETSSPSSTTSIHVSETGPC